MSSNGDVDVATRKRNSASRPNPFSSLKDDIPSVSSLVSLNKSDNDVDSEDSRSDSDLGERRQRTMSKKEADAKAIKEEQEQRRRDLQEAIKHEADEKAKRVASLKAR